MAKTYAANKNKVPRKSRRKPIARASWLSRQNKFQLEMDDSIFDSEDSLKDGYWMDPFDHIASGKTPLRQQKILHKSVCADYNRDSSIDCSPAPLSPLITTTYSRIDSPMPVSSLVAADSNTKGHNSMRGRSSSDQSEQKELASTPAVVEDSSTRSTLLHSIVARKLFTGVPGSFSLPGSSEMDSSCEANKVALNAGSRAPLLLKKTQRLFGCSGENAETSYTSFLDGMPPTQLSVEKEMNFHRGLPLISENGSQFFHRHGTPVTSQSDKENDPGDSERPRNVQGRMLNYTSISSDDSSRHDIFAAVISATQDFLNNQNVPASCNFLDCVEEVSEGSSYKSLPEETDQSDDRPNLAEGAIVTTRTLKSLNLTSASEFQEANDRPSILSQESVGKDNSSEVTARSFRSRTTTTSKAQSVDDDKNDTKDNDATSVESSDKSGQSYADRPPKQKSVIGQTKSKRKTSLKTNKANSSSRTSENYQTNDEASSLNDDQSTDKLTFPSAGITRLLRSRNCVQSGANRLSKNPVSQIASRKLRNRKNQSDEESSINWNAMSSSSTSSKDSSNSLCSQSGTASRDLQTTTEGSNGIRLGQIKGVASNSSKVATESAESIDKQRSSVNQGSRSQVQAQTKKYSLRSRHNLLGAKNQTRSSSSDSLQSSSNSTQTDSGIDENRVSSEVEAVDNDFATDSIHGERHLRGISTLDNKNVGVEESALLKNSSNATERSLVGAISLRRLKVELKRLKPDETGRIRHMELKLKRLKHHQMPLKQTVVARVPYNSDPIAQASNNTGADFSSELQSEKSVVQPRKYNLRPKRNPTDSPYFKSKHKKISKQNPASIGEIRNRNPELYLTKTNDKLTTANNQRKVRDNRKKTSRQNFEHNLQDTGENPSTINEELSINRPPEIRQKVSRSDRLSVLAEKSRQTRKLKETFGVARKSMDKTVLVASPLISRRRRYNLRSKRTEQDTGNEEQRIYIGSIQSTSKTNCPDSLEQNSWTSDIAKNENCMEQHSVENLHMPTGSQDENADRGQTEGLSVHEVTLNYPEPNDHQHIENNLAPDNSEVIIVIPTQDLGDCFNYSTANEANTVQGTPTRTISVSDTSSIDSIDSILGTCVESVLRHSINLEKRNTRHRSLRSFLENDATMDDLHDLLNHSDEDKSHSRSLRKRRTPSLTHETTMDTKKARDTIEITETINESELENDISSVNHPDITSSSTVEDASENASSEDICVDAPDSMLYSVNMTDGPLQMSRTGPMHTADIPEIRINADEASSLDVRQPSSTSTTPSSARSLNISGVTNISYNTTDITPNQTTMPSILDVSIDRNNFINAINQNATKFFNKSLARFEQSNAMNSSTSLSVRINSSIQDVNRNPSGTLGPPIRTSSKSIVSEKVSLVQELDEETIISSNDNSMNFTTDSLASRSVILSTGKWRRSLRKWKVATSSLSSKSIISVIDPNTTQNNSSQLTIVSSSIESKANTSPKNSSRSSYMQISSHRSIRANDSNSLNVLNASRRLNSSHKSRNKISELVSTLPELLNEYSISEEAISEQDEANVLLLEPTDDGTSNLRSISILESAVEKNLHISSSRSSQKSAEQATTEPTTTVVDSNYTRRIFNEFEEPTECRRQIYQHQLSVPVFRQPSLPRRSTSHIERCSEHSVIPIPTSGGRQKQQQRICNGTGDQVDDANLDCTNFNFLYVPYEGGIRSPSLSARDRVLRRCNQSEPLDFSVVYSENVLQHCRKIGEGVYGEVYMNKTTSGEAVVLKIIPIEGTVEVNGEQQKKFGEILSEIVIAIELSALRDGKNFKTGGFVEVKKVCCVQGRYPDHLIDCWELYRENYGTENDHPEIFPDDQLYMVFELANGGQDLEAFTFQNALQSYSAFIQTALTLAIAEQKFQFEHRDLHWGNILLAPTDDEEIVFRLKGEEIKVASHGVKVTIIDYTLSRMVYDGCCLYNDLSTDVELFLAGGDYQFDIYRLMKQHVKNQWETFEPFTNILWLHYTIDKMISGARYRCSKSKKHRSAIHDMMLLRDDLLSYKSASNYVECLNK